MSLGIFKEKQSWFTKTVLFVLAITFVVGFGYVGGVSIGGGGGSPNIVAATVNGEDISATRYYMVRQNLYRQFGEGIENLPEAAREYLDFSAMRQVIESKLLAQQARQLGLTVTDDELRQEIMSNPAFQIDGEFIGRENYKNTIRQALNISVAEFESGLKEELLVTKLLALIDETAKVTNEELYNLFRTENEKINLYYLQFAPVDFSDVITVRDEEVESYYENNKMQFLNEEKRKIKYLYLTQNDFKQLVEVTDAEIQAYYNSYKDEYTDSQGNLRELAEIRDEIENVLLQRKAAVRYENFRETINQLRGSSLQQIADGLSADSIKESDFFSRTRQDTGVPQPVLSQSFNMQTGELSHYLEDDGIWLFELSERSFREPRSLEEVRAEIIDIIKFEKGKEAARVAAEETLKKTLQSGSLKMQSGSVVSDVMETGDFTRVKAPSFIKDDEVRINLFLHEGENKIIPEVYSLGDSYYIFELKDRKEPSTDQFRNERERLRQQELDRMRRTITQEWVNRLFSEARINYNERLLSQVSAQSS